MSNTMTTEELKAELERRNKEQLDALLAETGYAECRWMGGNPRYWIRKNGDGTIDYVGLEICVVRHNVSGIIEDLSENGLFIFMPSTKEQFDAAVDAMFEKMRGS